MRLSSFIFACLLSLPVLAHDDDPKILDAQAPVAGSGYRPAAYLPGGSFSGMAGIGGGLIGTQDMLTSLDDNHISFPAAGVQLLSWLSMDDLDPAAFGANDCWGYVAPSGREYALIGLTSGTSFVEITNPSDPVIVHMQAGEHSLWRDIKVYQEYAYIVSEGGGGIQVVDLSQIDSGVVTLANTVFAGGTAASHNVAIDEVSGFLYRCGGSGNGLRIYSLSNPVSPNYVGNWNSRYVHDVQVVTYTSGPYSGKQIAFACSGFGNGSGSTGLTILDVTNKNSIQTRAQYYYSNAGYSHQAWLSDDRSTLYLNDELDEDGTLPTTTHVVGVSNIDSPQNLGTFTNGNPSIGHNLYTSGDLVFEANYRSGLRVFDTSGGPNASEVAYFDTWPGDDDAQFNGLWSCYPNFPSGLVIGSDRERGLFVWWVGERKLDLDLVVAAPSIVSPAGASVDIQISELTPGNLQPGSEMLYYDAGAGLVEVPLASLGGGTYQAQFPAMPCGETLRWFVGARSTDGILWTMPETAPYDHLEALVAEGEIVVFEDDFEMDRGWTTGSPQDTATAGAWRRADPVQTSVSPEDDHTPGAGTMCQVTGLTADIDGGLTTLTSPVIDMSGAGDATISFWMQFRKGGFTQGTDRMDIEISNDAGATWILVERVREISTEAEGTWTHHSYQATNWVTPTAATQLRFRIQDTNLNSDVKGLVDDFRVTQTLCPCEMGNYCSAALNSNGTAASIAASGNGSVSANNLTLQVSGAVPNGLGLFFYGAEQAQLPLAEGTLCVSGGVSGIQRLQPPMMVDGAGMGTRFLDLSAFPASSGPGAIGVGSTWNFQFWYRDPAGGPGGSNLSDGLEVTFCQ
ncbi:MAG: choice-of-anchor B domain-containing protein [Candidatus Paceibacteria bacterium]|jgi:choice-of-anchor B domain-containing protein